MQGRIINLNGGVYKVLLDDNNIVSIKARGKLRSEKMVGINEKSMSKKATLLTIKNSPKVGDIVLVKNDMIDQILPRKNQLIRPDIANVDQILLVFAACEPDFSFYLLAGGGIGFFNCELSNPNGLQSGGLTSYEGKEFGTSAGAKRTSNKDITGIIPLGFAIEFNISRMFAIGAKGMYHLHTQDNLDSWVFSEPIRGGTTNDIMEYMTVNFRWKIPSRKADHKRNWRDPEPMFTPYDNMNYSQRNSQPDTVVVVYKPQPDTIYIAVPQQQPEKVTGRQAAAMPTAAPASSAYFDNNKNKLTDDALIAIHSIAMQMQADTTLYLEIRGYCDNTGSKAYNEKLSRQRAEIAKNELVSVWKIAPERIIANGYGIIAEPPKTYKPNRRVDFRFISAEEAETLKNEQEQARENCVSADETRTYSQFIVTEKIKQDETLGGLAERFYGQPLFWVYIYEANQETIQNPDNITTDMEIKIPVLPQELADSSNPACIKYAKQLQERYTQQQ